MKERIARALVARGRVEERRRLEVGYISTIHTFCELLMVVNLMAISPSPARFASLSDFAPDIAAQHAGRREKTDYPRPPNSSNIMQLWRAIANAI